MSPLDQKVRTEISSKDYVSSTTALSLCVFLCNQMKFSKASTSRRLFSILLLFVSWVPDMQVPLYSYRCELDSSRCGCNAWLVAFPLAVRPKLPLGVAFATSHHQARWWEASRVFGSYTDRRKRAQQESTKQAELIFLNAGYTQSNEKRTKLPAAAMVVDNIHSSTCTPSS